MNIAESIRHLALRGCEMYLCACTVDSVDEEARTIDCTPLDEGAQLIGVNLQADQSGEVGVVSFPAVGSDVVVGFINPAVAVVVLTTELTKSVLKIGSSEITVEDGSVNLTNGNVNATFSDTEINLQNGENIKATFSSDKINLKAGEKTLEMSNNGVVWNGGSETTANATELQSQLKNMSARIDRIIEAINESAVGSMDGGAFFKTNMMAKLSTPPLIQENFENIIDQKIKH
ncbi:MAG: hypothetical protein HDS83_02345 [Bacteroidales bacterium]|nr:hypothetical protein [Bacteroidales bacterium]